MHSYISSFSRLEKPSNIKRNTVLADDEETEMNVFMNSTYVKGISILVTYSPGSMRKLNTSMPNNHGVQTNRERQGICETSAFILCSSCAGFQKAIMVKPCTVVISLCTQLHSSSFWTYHTVSISYGSFYFCPTCTLPTLLHILFVVASLLCFFCVALLVTKFSNTFNYNHGNLCIFAYPGQRNVFQLGQCLQQTFC